MENWLKEHAIKYEIIDDNNFIWMTNYQTGLMKNGKITWHNKKDYDAKKKELFAKT